jgi:autotransporter adhesin
MALGASSNVTGTQGVGVGVYTQVNTSQSAAVGYGSVTSSGRDNVVSVGSGRVPAQDSNGNFIPIPAPKTRIIENVTDGQRSQDAATVNQLPGQFVTVGGAASSAPTNYYRFGNDATSGGPMTTSSSSVTLRNVAPGEVSATSTEAVNGSQLYAAINQANQHADGVAAMANRHADGVAAMAAATSMTPMFGPKGYSLTVATANVGSQNALGIGFARSFLFKDNPAYWQASVGFNNGSRTSAVKVGASIGW